MAITDLPRTIQWVDGTVHMIDQTRLPLTGDLLVVNTVEGMVTAITSLAVRGAPAIGAAGALGVALWSQTVGKDMPAADDAYLDSANAACDALANARPTAVNLPREVENQRARLLADAAAGRTPAEIHEKLVAAAVQVCADDEAANRALGAHGAALFEGPTNFLTHCNAGSLATSFYGTALGVIYAAFEQGKVNHVWVDETRPVNQGGRLTAWELLVAGVPSTLICDNMAATVMREGWVDAVVVGADRICANGDTANKIGTLGVAVLAREFGVPFYIAAPWTTIDMNTACGADIVIEERDPREIEGITVTGGIEPDSASLTMGLDALTRDGVADLPLTKGHTMQIRRKGGAYAFDGWFKNTPTHVRVFNPAFDVTPAEYIAGIITERGVFAPDALGDALG
ncbi:MAG: S-methyl-5-thioribose-1-phosphate isomerase [Actinomycetes bacterium]|jgi:methylthioribose-1-phosphate isomerase|nr:S-methyl-5-thioribose-1-phosphate isomerase [Actinomycetes bacterium]